MGTDDKYGPSKEPRFRQCPNCLLIYHQIQLDHARVTECNKCGTPFAQFLLTPEWFLKEEENTNAN